MNSLSTVRVSYYLFLLDQRKNTRWLAEPWQHVRIIEPCPYTAHHGGVLCYSRHCGHSGSGDGVQVSLGAAHGPRKALAQCAHMLGTESYIKS